MFSFFGGKKAEASPAGKPGEAPAQPITSKGSSSGRDQVKYALEKKPLGVGEHFAYTGNSAGLPVLIVPGFMSSGLVIEKSEAKPEWKGKRAWLDLKSLDLKHADAPEAETAQQPESAAQDDAAKGDSVGAAGAAHQKQKGFGAMIQAETSKTAKAVQAATCRKMQEIQDGGIDRLLSVELDGPDYDGGLGLEESDSSAATPSYKKKHGEWIRHLLPGDEGWKDPKGVEVRAVNTNEGLDGVTRLTDKDGSSSFAKVVQLLEMVGYQRGVNLQAMPYDWRLPPKALEERDGYFTRFKETVEKMVKAAGKPVVLLSHSLGGKVVHYFLSWVVNVYKAPGKGKFDAKAWIDKHIHTFIPLGGPFLGVPKRARCVISGDDLGLGSTLTFDEALRVGRGLGSQHFLTPHASLLEGTTLPSFFFMRSASRVLVRLKSIEGDLSKTVVNEGGFFLSLKLDKKRLRTRRLTSNNTDRLSLEDDSEPNLFQFSSEINELQGTLSVGLFGGPMDESKDLWNNALFQESVMKLSEFDLQAGEPMSITAPLTMKDSLSPEQVHPVMLIMEVTYEPPHVMNGLVDSKLDQALFDSGFADTKEDSKKTKQKVAVVPPGPGLGSEPRSPEEDGPCPELLLPAVSLEARGGFMAMEKREGVAYAHRNPEEMMMLDDMSEVYGSWQKNYRGDPAYGVDGLAAAAPSVPRVFAIYGVNCPTEVGAAYRYRNFYRKLDKVNSGLVLDTEASLAQSSGYTIQKGIIKETPATKQKVADNGEVVAVSGDGTVPYASLRHCMSWESAGVDVRCSEIQKCTHRGVLFSPEVHKLLLDYICTKPALYLLVKSITVNCDDDVKAHFMDHKGDQIFVEITFKGKTFRTELKGGSSTTKFTKRQFGLGVTQAELDADEKPRCSATLCKAHIMTKAVECIGINTAMKAMGFSDPNAGGRTKLGVASLNAWHTDKIRASTRSVKHEFMSSKDGSPLGISITVELEATFGNKQK